MYANIQHALFAVTDDNGQISYSMAACVAIMHDLWVAFDALYGHMYGEPVDTGEFLVWLGY
jgi:hypothetical protein